MFLISAVALLGLLIFSRHLPVILIGVSLSGILFSLCILFCESAPRWLLRSLELRPLLFLGEASYALYILQDPVAGVMGSALHALMHLRMDESPKLTVVFIVALVVISAGVYEWIERPARIRLRKLAFGNVPAG
jgi:peptidoglycan/LPS O-acetylase OafA/YrhL